MQRNTLRDNEESADVKQVLNNRKKRDAYNTKIDCALWGASAVYAALSVCVGIWSVGFFLSTEAGFLSTMALYKVCALFTACAVSWAILKIYVVNGLFRDHAAVYWSRAQYNLLARALPGGLEGPFRESTCFVSFSLLRACFVLGAVILMRDLLRKWAGVKSIAVFFFEYTAVLWIFFADTAHTQNKIWYFLVSRAFKVVASWRHAAPYIEWLVSGRWVAGYVYVFWMFAMLWRPFAGWVKALMCVHIAWTLAIHYTTGILVGYLYAEALITEGVPVSAVSGGARMFRQVLRRAHRVCGVSLLFGYLIVVHAGRGFLYRHRKVPGPRVSFARQARARYDQIEIECLYYILDGEYYHQKAVALDVPCSAYWISTKCLYVGHALLLDTVVPAILTAMHLVSGSDIFANYVTGADLEFDPKAGSLAHSFLFLGIGGVCRWETSTWLDALLHVLKHTGALVSLLVLHASTMGCLLMSFRAVMILRDNRVGNTRKISTHLFNQMMEEASAVVSLRTYKTEDTRPVPPPADRTYLLYDQEFIMKLYNM